MEEEIISIFSSLVAHFGNRKACPNCCH